ncbi:MAG: nucleotidyltransferase domain-containing protein [Thermomicrobiales bacterium]|nr:nucleotidyltransferase domain-containing protein [Thermomicrobiales bacterium]
MHPIITEHRADIFALCREYGVEKLELFGSVCTDTFDESRSDIDFIVHYGDNVDLGPWLQRHFELKSKLAELLGRPVDLLMAMNHRNPYIQQSIDETRRVLYAA